MVSRVEQKLSAGVARLIIEKDLVRRGGSVRDDGFGPAGGDADHIARDGIIRRNCPGTRNDRDAIAHRLTGRSARNATAHVDLRPRFADQHGGGCVWKGNGRAGRIRRLRNGNNEAKAPEHRSVSSIPAAGTRSIGGGIASGARHRNPDADGRINGSLNVGPRGEESDITVGRKAGGSDARGSSLSSRDNPGCTNRSHSWVCAAPGDGRTGENQAS